MYSPNNWTSKDLAEKLQLQRSDTYGNFQTFSGITKKINLFIVWAFHIL